MYLVSAGEELFILVMLMVIFRLTRAWLAGVAERMWEEPRDPTILR